MPAAPFIEDLPHAPAPALAIPTLSEFQPGRAPKPVECGHGVVVGAGSVVPEINFTLPAVEITPDSWPAVRRQYQEMIEAICRRAVELSVPALLVEFETLPPMTERPDWGLELTAVLRSALDRFHDRNGLRTALRLTPNDARDMERPPHMRSGPMLDCMRQLFATAGPSGADLLAIESTGGKEVSDAALMAGDLRQLVFALGVLAPRDVAFLWREMVDSCRAGGVVPSGDTACGFANTAMVLAEQRLVPRVLAAVVRVASVPRDLVAFEQGAIGPSKDCALEGPYLKAIAGVPIAMEGRSAACAHLSPLGNVAQAVCDCWSNESVQNVRLLSASAPVVSLEQLTYDCRLMDAAAATPGGAGQMRDWLAASDVRLDPQAWVLDPAVVLRLSAEIIRGRTPYERTVRGTRAALQELRCAAQCDALRLSPVELRWLERLARQAELLPDDEAEMIDQMLGELTGVAWLPTEYGL